MTNLTASPDASLTDSTVVIVGGTSGFGLEVANQAAAQGARLVLVGRDEAKLHRVLDGFTTPVTGYAADAGDPASAQTLFDRIGEFDHLVSTVGGAMGGGFLSAPIAEIRQTVEGKFLANLTIVRAAAPRVRANGSLTLTAGAGGAPHTASGALIGNQAIGTLARGLAVELAPEVRVNAVAPAWTPTPLWRDLAPEDLESTRRQMAESFPLQRTATIPEVAQAYLFLMTATFVTGQTLYVDGGASLI
ncbi:SDR family oxidoreductase [Aeromicrobium camelliae]|uniref:SDR family oxidoreductase n=1 Tax=Aeromicrobium camelliae TaxID=1538144 RepID=A0A3N6Z5X1_9ACTN|nr:SDR family oxidoreductase [Aeromicrobium camelliae]RQN02327.1 SDR family oxidoreductase [Aeromicrobium camelliae]